MGDVELYQHVSKYVTHLNDNFLLRSKSLCNKTDTIQRMGSGELKSKSKAHRINALRRIRLKIEATAAFKAGLKVEDKELEEKIPEKEEKESLQNVNRKIQLLYQLNN